MTKRMRFLAPAVFCAALPLASYAVQPDAACADCHGKDGASTEADVPIIGGVSEQYLIDSMAAYRDKKRPCPETKYRAGDTRRAKTDMCQVAAKLSADETAKIAKDLSAEPFVKAKQKFDAAKAAAGRKVHDVACEKCHSEGGGVKDDDAGILAGQQMGYLKATFDAYSHGMRPQPPKMKDKYDKLKPEELEALLHYYASEQ